MSSKQKEDFKKKYKIDLFKILEEFERPKYCKILINLVETNPKLLLTDLLFKRFIIECD